MNDTKKIVKQPNHPKTCPLSLIGIGSIRPSVLPVKEHFNDISSLNCLGSQCMFWSATGNDCIISLYFSWKVSDLSKKFQDNEDISKHFEGLDKNSDVPYR